MASVTGEFPSVAKQAAKTRQHYSPQGKGKSCICECLFLIRVHGLIAEHRYPCGTEDLLACSSVPGGGCARELQCINTERE